MPFYLNWWDREEAQANCDHQFEMAVCDCGAQLGEWCPNCGVNREYAEWEEFEPEPCTCNQLEKGK